jgi:hypothetical protein
VIQQLLTEAGAGDIEFHDGAAVWWRAKAAYQGGRNHRVADADDSAARCG